ncbi:uncharacterized protein TRIVIDRAFT_53976 [Trichoderma virens Gv29-8]|uniref:Zn(2)-C6 fungal-type domain-containing protein n=1 Tax=Hypocrea virens (strain Gv29-8 / FGSC 10586) TaxID=413071 RepID=G9MRL0_HYPVG|nr:uncharacterized protein TRIVIDRAFT_53976 [Trichoderma virens Gv29-8]EHK22731.1 hypothetical protein TRIVIDRAFT_53976 [Trichoderma virens Gv29-8]UKZ47782.1 hypothetical protein TrVGV298_002011 [Trichoderma virens]
MEKSQVHNEESVPAQLQVLSGRQRVRKACLECRRRKRKCDDLTPCRMCAQYGYDCIRDDDSAASETLKMRAPDVVLEGGQPSQPIRISETPESIVNQTPVPSLDRGIIEPARRRYMSQNSAVAFPNQLGMELESANPPRLHSFAWNCGIRDEEPGSIHAPLSQYVNLEGCQHYANIYFATVNKAFHLFDSQHFLQMCDTYFHRRNEDLILGATIGGVIALGSLFAFNEGHPLESQIVKHVKDVLEDSTFSRLPSIDQINAWILRTLYLRATTRPHLTWLSSCTVMHLVEAVGLHRDLESDLVTQSGQVRAKEDEGGKRTFWLAWCINTIISYEYGRTRVHINGIDPRATPFDNHSETGLQIRMARILPSENTNADIMALSKSLETAIQQLLDLGDISGFPALTRGDLCFCLYRRLRLLKVAISKETLANIIQIGHTAVEVAIQLANREAPWWNVLGTPFQFFCVLLAIDTRAALTKVSWVVPKLERIATILGTHMAREAVETAHVLLSDAWAKKRQEIALLEMSEGNVLPLLNNREPTPDWDAMLNPFYAGDFNVKDFGI